LVSAVRVSGGLTTASRLAPRRRLAPCPRQHDRTSRQVATDRTCARDRVASSGPDEARLRGQAPRDRHRPSVLAPAVSAGEPARPRRVADRAT